VCAFIWDKLTYYTGYQIGYVAIGVGFAVGTATMIGASGKRGISLQIVSGLLSLFGILLGETLLVMDSYRDYLAANPGAGNANMSPLALFVSSVMILPQSLTESPMSFLFMAVGVYYGFTIPAREKEDAAPDPEPSLQTDAPAPSFPTVPNATSSTPLDASAKSGSTPFDAPPKP
jgi:hypothetical protein